MFWQVQTSVVHMCLQAALEARFEARFEELASSEAKSRSKLDAMNTQINLLQNQLRDAEETISHLRDERAQEAQQVIIICRITSSPFISNLAYI